MGVIFIDFSNVWVQLCCAGNKRVSDAYAAAFNILMNVRGCRLTVMFNQQEEEMSEEAKDRRDLLKALANVTYNQFYWICYPTELSKAQMIERTMRTTITGTDPKWVLNVDDDYMIPHATLKLLEMASKKKNSDTDMYMYGQFDLINYKNHPDWSDRRFEMKDIMTFVEKYGRRLLVHHLMADQDVSNLVGSNHFVEISMPGQSTGSHMFRLHSYLDRVLMRNQFFNWPKGKRGYDDVLCNNIGKVSWIAGSNSYHSDRTKKILDGELWKEDVFRDDMKMDGKPSGRIPEKAIWSTDRR